jgi:hypothetical protein
MRLRHVLGPLSVAAMVALLIVACLVTKDSPYAFDGGSLGSCTGNVAREVSLAECPVCAVDGGGTAYTQCIGSNYNGCTCQLTCGYTLLNADGTVAEGGPRGQAVGSVQSQACACSGKLAEEMPGSSCFGCTGKTAYALCDDTGGFQCNCACDLPPGYAVTDGGSESLQCDAGGD